MPRSQQTDGPATEPAERREPPREQREPRERQEPPGSPEPREARESSEARERAESPEQAEARPRRRQARGERRIAQLLQAAAAVFCRTGYTAASTNAIAREAGVSPGTLYQFFPNKEAIAVGLGEQLLQQWQESSERALADAHLALPLDEMLDAALDPLIAFNVENPAFGVLLHGPDTPGAIAQEHNAVHDASLTRIEALIAGYLPSAAPDERARTANMLLGLFKAGLDLIMSHEGGERQAYISELKTAMHRYLSPLQDGTPR
ncbi:TetR/AcrR family transcriptional regulator [Streptomyces sp. NPDC048664]|uniref:TetR/AcrR family transcriptional regulator n=1 Tax=Streptomyces sp. NPDC048664 TaxID=3154505 RepID=UPI00342B8843